MVSRILKTELIDWQNAEWLQGNLKKISKEALANENKGLA